MSEKLCPRKNISGEHDSVNHVGEAEYTFWLIRVYGGFYMHLCLTKNVVSESSIRLNILQHLTL